MENKLIVNAIDKYLEIPSGSSELYFDNDLVIDKIVFANTFDTVWYIKKDVKVNIQSITELNNTTGSIKIVTEDNSSLVFHLGIKASKNNNIDLLNEINGNNNNCEIMIRIISEEDSKTNLKATGIINKNTHNNNYIEDIKYLNEYPANIICLPELIVNSDDASASHNMTVGMIDEEELFYLESRGIPTAYAKEMIRTSFLKSMQRRE